MTEPRVFAVMVTHERPDVALATLSAMLEQTRPPDSVTVVDHSRQAMPDPILEEGERVSILRTGENLGPAGGLAVGTRRALELAGDDDWLLFVDDDDPPADDLVIERLISFGERCRGHVELGGVGLAGGRFDRRWGLLRRVPDEELGGTVAVDYLGGNQFPCYRVGAIRYVGPPRADLFFGFDDLELGLRLRRAGFDLLVDGEDWGLRRRAMGRAGMTARQAAAVRRRSSWRRYYGSRNLVWLSLNYGARGAALVTLARSSVLAGLADAWRARSFAAASPALRGGLHGWRSKLGRTILPETN